ncbi:gephyrin-like molybdotransferase Glp [Brevibacillus choshinensis]|uniref:molybdopterin molybdotransferase MoeA n=1 Tax=Brevibacillus choshinensis TaxID=54911 RepID=UPI002E23C09B|nr:gephyrin-like molybdotransferase Glp [Brevibacillus choshinensis]MED4753263.1 molybdopterin molybdotransferase MoeA [Brevibacillus choshinensis]
MRFSRQMITVEEAMRRLMERLTMQGREEVHIGEAYGRTLAIDVHATDDLPHFDRSPLDGYAVRAIDTVLATPDQPVRLKVVETIAAGDVPKITVAEGCASRIMTGAMMPSGADTVIMFEQTVQPAAFLEEVGIKRALKQGENVSRRGEEIASGAVIVRAGERINAGTLAILATFGYTHVPVVRKPRIGLLSTGVELLDVDQPLHPGKIRNSNTWMLSALIDEAGGIPLLFPNMPDELDVAKGTLAEHLKMVDVLVTSGGVSVGDYDVMAALSDEPEAELLFNRIAMRPGSPTTSLMLQGKPIIALSGNPGACFLGFELFVRPAVQKLSGVQGVHLRTIKARLAVTYSKPCPYPRYLRGWLLEKDGVLYAQPDFNEKAGNLGTLKNSECFIVIPAGGSGKQTGELVEVLSHAAPSWKREGSLT